jgi:hypothetical protein
MSVALWYSVSVSLLCAFGMIALWATLVTRRLVPEFEQGRRDIVFHIVAEVGTAALLVAGAAATIVEDGAIWARLLSAFAFGALVYTLVNSPGYYADRGNRSMLALFAVLGLLAVPAAVIRLAIG